MALARYPALIIVVAILARNAFAVGIHVQGGSSFDDNFRIVKVGDSKWPFSHASCSRWLMAKASLETGPGSPLDRLVEQTVHRANQSFRGRREWDNEEFLLSRFNLAKKYAARTESRVVINTKTGEIVGAIAMTTAKYKKENLPDFSKPAKDSESIAEILPEEESLGILPLYRPVGPRGKGVILEFRTFFVDKEYRKEIRTQLFGQILEMTYDLLSSDLGTSHLAGEPSDAEFLWDQPIIKIYNDEAGIKLYHDYGFWPIAENGQLLPVNRYDTDWWTLANSPENFETNLVRLALTGARQFTVEGNTQPLKIDLSSRLSVNIRALSKNTVDKSKGDFSFFTEGAINLGQGIIGAPGAQVQIKNNELVYVADLMRDCTINGQHLRAGAEVWFEPGMKVAKVQYPMRIAEDFHDYFDLSQDFDTQMHGHSWGKNYGITQSTKKQLHIQGTSIVIPVGSSITWDEHSLGLWSIHNNSGAWEILPGLFVKQSAFAKFFDGPDITISRLAKPYEVMPGIEVMPDQDFGFWLGPHDEVIWAQFVLAQDTWMDGHLYPKGTRLKRNSPTSPTKFDSDLVYTYKK